MIPWHLQEKYHSKDKQTKGKRKPTKPTNPKRRGAAESKDGEEVVKEEANAKDQAQNNNQGVEKTEEERKEKFVVYNR